MIPSIPIPTDNVYKFACLCGLALMVSAFFGFISSYSSALDTKLKHYELMAQLEGRDTKTKTDTDMIAMHKKVIEVTKENEQAVVAVCAVFFLGGAISAWYGISNWRNKIQARDDRLALMQIGKMEMEAEKLSLDIIKVKRDLFEMNVSVDNVLKHDT